MINHPSIITAIENGRIKKGEVIVLNQDSTLLTFTCVIQKIIYDRNEIIVKLKTGKDYPLGHKYIYRSIEELL